MGVISQCYDPPTLPLFKEPVVSSEQGAGWAPENILEKRIWNQTIQHNPLPSHQTDAFPGFLAVWIKIKCTLQLLVCVKTDVSMEVSVHCGLVSCDAVYVCSVTANHLCFGGLLKDPVKCYLLSARLRASVVYYNNYI